MTRPWLVMLNSTRTALAPAVFSVIIGTEIFLCIVGIICMPFVSQAIYNAGVIHRNFRIQVRLISGMFVVAALARFILVYYQLLDIQLDDYDVLLIGTCIVRDASFGYMCGVIPSFALERGVATVFWKWYERQTPDTMGALFLIEMANILPATINSTGWLFGWWNFTCNVICIMLTVVAGGALFLLIYFYNCCMLRTMSISINDYSCLMRAGIPAGSVTALGFSFFCYFKWGPEEWRLSRYISIALFDLFTIIFSLFFMVLAINMDAEFQRQFNSLPLVPRIRSTLRMKPPTYKKSVLKSAHYEQPGIIDTTDSYFRQLEKSWLR